ncbi:N-acetylneuraminate synthase family protein [Terasakiella sp. SH-1]|uniref:N-acetylneuraminate synthase family protein n=1 Tax=Terasakiella sp. SH-1 TaxID=2560057 RepID=UPI0010730A90|nr:N-acetylneuraminate synthase family protein [Terasakiella sp. SH-1]
MQNFKQTFLIGNMEVGVNCPPLILPDIGTFFNRDMKEAKRLVRTLKDTGCKIIKGEILHDSTICLDDDTEEIYLDNNDKQVHERYRQLIERKVVDLQSYEDLFKLVKELEMEFILSVYDITGADFAIEQGACALKIASSNITHRPLIEYIAQKNIPMILDTGKSTMEEISRAISWVLDAGCNELIIEHSPDAPPAPVDNHNLRFMCALGEIFGVPFGLSDHHNGEEMMVAATALGASILETGVCLNKKITDQDVRHATEVYKIAEVIKSCNNVYQALGTPYRHLSIERPEPKARMGLVAKNNLQQNHILSFDDLHFAFPPKGISAADYKDILGRQLISSVPKGAIIEWSNVKYATS